MSQEMIKNMLQRLLSGFFLLFTMIVILGVAPNMWGQSEKSKCKTSAFNTVSSEFKEKLLQRFELFMHNKREENFENLYEMLNSSFRELNKKEDFVKEMKSYYSGNDGFISFKPDDVGEVVSTKDGKPDLWFIHGCLTEVINGKNRSVRTLLEAIREDKEIFFTDITTRPNPLGNNQKCKP